MKIAPYLRRAHLLGLLLWMATFLFGCGSQSDEAPLDSVEVQQGAQPTVKITGTIRTSSGSAIAGVTVTLTGAASATTTTASNGTYAFTGLKKGSSYTVKPTRTGCTFVPASTTLSPLSVDTVADFTGSCGGAQDAGADADACVPTTCAAQNRTCGSLANGCGGTLQCGTCPTGQTCSTAGQCVCQPATTCPAGQNCGTAPDGCGGTIDCGTCVPGARCSGNPKHCSCTPATTCPAGQNCGTASNGCGGVISCGTCPTGTTCGPSNTCLCVPRTTCPAGQQCGTAPDGCGGVIDCGSCAPGTVCSNNTCVCQLRTTCPAGQICGTAPDGCGGQVNCGTCPTGTACNTSGTSCDTTCVPKTACDGGQNCGTAPDGCGGTISCGVCTAPATCGGGGQPGVCGQNACAPFNGGGPCTPTEQRFVNKSVDCYNCMANAGCLDDVLFNDVGHECSDVAGTAVRGARTGTSRAQLCLDTIDCVMNPAKLCASTDVTICYCGSLGAGNACSQATAGQPDGACVNEELDGLEHLATEAPSVILPDYTELGLGAGMANQLFNCAKANSCDALCSQ